jgi:hypothetical protein
MKAPPIPPSLPGYVLPKPPKRRRASPEADFQRSLVRDLGAILLPPFVLHHSANEVRRAGREGRIAREIAKGMGVHPGFADLVLLSAKQAVFFELKSATGTLSEDQIAFRDFVRGQGHGWALIRTLDDALAALKAFGIPTRIRSAGECTCGGGVDLPGGSMFVRPCPVHGRKGSANGLA